MHYERTVEQDKYDVRSKTYLVFKCGGCGYEDWIVYRPGINKDLQRPCPKPNPVNPDKGGCGMEDDSQELDFLLNQQSVLEQEIKERQAKLEAVRSKINVVQTIQSLPTARNNNETLQSSGGNSGGDVLKDEDRG